MRAFTRLGVLTVLLATIGWSLVACGSDPFVGSWSGPAAGGQLIVTIEKTDGKYLISDPRGYGSQKREASLENGKLEEKGTALTLERQGDKLIARLPGYPVGVFELTKQ